MLTHVTVKEASFAKFLVMFGLMSNSNFYAQTKTNPTHIDSRCQPFLARRGPVVHLADLRNIARIWAARPSSASRYNTQSTKTATKTESLWKLYYSVTQSQITKSASYVSLYYIVGTVLRHQLSKQIKIIHNQIFHLQNPPENHQ